MALWWNLFFTVNLLKRRDTNLLTQHIDLLRGAVAETRKHHRFVIHGWVVLPDHLHCLIELPVGDHDFAKRWAGGGEDMLDYKD